MPPEKVTKMVLDVDLKCSDCYKKVKKIICKIPQIRDQEYDVDKNKVKITVICCCPERIRDKLCYKGGDSIQGIQILQNLKDPDKPKPKPTDKPKDRDKPKPKPADETKDGDKPKDSGKAKGEEKAKAVDKAPKEDVPQKTDPSPKAEGAKMMFEPPVHGYPQMYPSAYPMVGYGQYYEGYGGEPFQRGYGMHVAPPQHGYGMPLAPPQQSGYGYGYRYEHGFGGGRNGDYFSEENSQGCFIM